MTRNHTPAVLLVPVLLAGGACAGLANAQMTFELTDSGQAFGEYASIEIALGDLDGDGDLDAFGANADFKPNAVWINDGTGILTDSGQSLGVSNSISVALGDLDGDGDLDALVANGDFVGLLPNIVWTNDGEGTFSDSGQALGNSNSRSVALGDLDGDGDLDAMVANCCGQPNTVWTNDGTGIFTDSGQALGTVNSWNVALGDLDGDGDLDAVVANNSQPSTVWTNDGTGTFTDSGQGLLPPVGGYSAVALGDLDGDGDLDAKLFSAGFPNSVWFNDGAGVFTDSGQALRGNLFSEGVALGDLDGDGDVDAIGANTVWTNDGTGIFTDSGEAPGPLVGVSVALGDLDGDGALDAMAANYRDPNAVWINDASNVSAVYNRNSGTWSDSATQAVASASSGDTLLLGGASFDVAGIIDARGRPLTFEARAPITFGTDLLFMASNGSTFLDWSGNGAGYAVQGRILAPERGSLVFSDLDVTTDGELLQNDAFLIGYSDITNSAGTCYLKGELSADSVQTVDGGVNYVAADTNVFGDYLNAGSTIIQRGTLYIYGDLTNTGTLSGEYNTGFAGGGTPEPGDGFSIGGSYTIGRDATLSMPDPVWWLRVGGDLDVAIDDPTRFGMSEATIEMSGLATSNQQTLETMSLDLGPNDVGFQPTNFAIGTLRIVNGSTTHLVNRHPNSGGDPCEVVYVDELVVEGGGGLATNGCTVYVRSASIDGRVDDPDAIVVVDEQPPCLGDFNGDLAVTGADLGVMIGFWGTAGGDLNDDGTTNGADLGLLIGVWGDCP